MNLAILCDLFGMVIRDLLERLLVTSNDRGSKGHGLNHLELELSNLSFLGKGNDLLRVGGFNPVEKYWSKWESSPSRGENKKSLKPPTSFNSKALTFWWIFRKRLRWP